MIKVIKEALPWCAIGAILPIGFLAVFFGILNILS